jgi:toxin ParE1/3/4
VTVPNHADERIVLTPLAKEDIGTLAEYLRQEAGLTVALRFVAKTKAAFRTLAGTPLIGASLHLPGVHERDIRRWHIDRFESFLILYRPANPGIEIVRVLHGSRDIEALFQHSAPEETTP